MKRDFPEADCNCSETDDVDLWTIASIEKQHVFVQDDASCVGDADVKAADVEDD